MVPLAGHGKTVEALPVRQVAGVAADNLEIEAVVAGEVAEVAVPQHPVSIVAEAVDKRDECVLECVLVQGRRSSHDYSPSHLKKTDVEVVE